MVPSKLLPHRGLLLTATVTVAAGPSKVKIIEHAPLALAQGGTLLEYVSKDPDALTAALITRWSPGHSPILVARLRHIVLCKLQPPPPPRRRPRPSTPWRPRRYQTRRSPSSYTRPLAISQLLPPQLRPTWDRLRVREVVAAFWAPPNDVHAVLQTTQIPTMELIPLKFGLLAWASSGCPLEAAHVSPRRHPPLLDNKGMWPPQELRPLLECSVLPDRCVKPLHQI